MKHDIQGILAQMTLEEKAGMCSGLDFWHLKAVPRLGIPSVMVSDGPHGLRKQEEKGDHLGINDSIKAVCFPPAVLSACSFDRELMRAFGNVIGREAQATNVSVVLGPAVNMKRSPLCGRNFEYYSEDPYLAGELAAAFVQGVQSHHVGTSVKHFAANSQETRRMTCSSEVDERTLREIYLPAFEKAVKQAQPYTIMCSYNRINGTFASENDWLLNKVLRDDWGFKGMVVSDWGAVNEMVDAVKAGLELEMPSSEGFSEKQLVEAVRSGRLEERVLDRAVERILTLIFRWEENREVQEFTMEQDHAFARRIAEESMVLLKNDGILPLKKGEKILFVGEYAQKPRYQGGGSSHINSFKVSDALTAAAEYAAVSYARGFSGRDDTYDETLAKEALEAAKSADKVVVFAGLPDSFESEGYDRAHMDLPACQNRLIAELAAVNPNLVVVLHNGASVTMPWLSSARGLLEAYLGGQAGGEAVAAILFGAVNPSGKLAESFPVKLSDNPSYLNFGGREKVEYHEGVFIGYRYYDKKEMRVLFPFGHGLSYTSFAYSNLRLSRDTMGDGETLTVSVDVTNTGDRAGKETVQLYVADHTGAVQRPLRELKGFEKLELEPGETKTAVMTLDDRAFSWYSEELGDWYAAPGEYEITVGASSRDLRLSKCVQYKTERILPLHISLNTTLGELLENAKTRPLGLMIAERVKTALGGDSQSEAASESISDEMNAAMLADMPLRGALRFGVMPEAELQAEIEKYNN